MTDDEDNKDNSAAVTNSMNQDDSSSSSDEDIDIVSKPGTTSKTLKAPEGSSLATFNEPLVFDVKISQVNDIEYFFQYLNDDNVKQKDVWDYMNENLFTLLACIAMDDTFNKDKTDQVSYYGLVKTHFELAVSNLPLEAYFGAF